jgi:hypothetical protein
LLLGGEDTQWGRVLYPVSVETGKAAARETICCAGTGSALRASDHPPPDRIQWSYLRGNKYSYYAILHTPTVDQKPPLVQPDGHHIRFGMELGLEH